VTGLPASRHDAQALASRIGHDGTRALAALEASIEAARTHASLGAISWLEAEPARRRAEAAARCTRSPFAGVPTLAKDLGGPFRSLPVRAGSRAVPPEAANESTLGSRLRSAGLNAFGLTTVPEFGLSLGCEPAAGPIARNPLDPTRTPGGSSGGAAAAVASGIVAIAHATDAGGSIRVPAACCGLFGIKPSRGVVPGGPDFGNLLGGLASESLLCRSTRDLSHAFDAIAGGDGPFPEPALPPALDTPRIGLLLPPDGIDEQRLAVLEAAALALSAEPIRIDSRRVAPLLSDSAEVFDRLISANLATLCETLSLDESLMEPLSRAVAARGRAMSIARLWTAFDLMARVANRSAALFDEIDVLVLPMLSRSPPPLGHFPTDHEEVETHWERLRRFAPNATWANVSGCPALSLPFGSDADGLPLPLQLMARVGADRTLLRTAKRLDDEGRWQQRFPVAGMPSDV